MHQLSVNTPGFKQALGRRAARYQQGWQFCPNHPKKQGKGAQSIFRAAPAIVADHKVGRALLGQGHGFLNGFSLVDVVAPAAQQVRHGHHHGLIIVNHQNTNTA